MGSRPLHLRLHLDHPGPGLDVRALCKGLEQTLGSGLQIGVVDRESSVFSPTAPAARRSLAAAIAATKVTHPATDLPQGMGRRRTPFEGEVQFELRRLQGTASAAGILYDGFWLQQVLAEMLPRNQASRDWLHLLLTNRLVGSYDHSDRRWHARMVLGGQPSIVSTTGMVLAPALPRVFYTQRHLHEQSGSGVLGEHLRVQMGEQVLQHDDPRQTEVALSLTLQAALYWQGLEAFCTTAGCRLEDTHAQDALMRTHLQQPRLCPRHARWASQFPQRQP